MSRLRSTRVAALTMSALFATAALHAQSVVPQGAATHPMSIADIMAIRNVGAPMISNNGALVAFQVSAWEHPNAKTAPGDTALGDKHDMRSHLWLVPADGASEPRQITFSERGESQPAFSPDGATLAFISARGSAAAGEDAPRPELYLMPLSGGEAAELTHVRDGVTGYTWSPDGKSIAFLTTDSSSRGAEARIRRRDDEQIYEGDQKLAHVWIVDVASRRAREIAHSTRYTVRGAPSWSPDGSHLAFLTSPSTLTRDGRRTAYIIDASGGALREIHVTGDIEQTPEWSPDGRTLAFSVLAQTHVPHGDSIADRELRNSHLVLYDVASAAARDVSDEQQFDNSPGTPVWSSDGRGIYFTAGDRVWSDVYRYDIANKRYTQLTDRQLIRGLSFSKGDSRVVTLRESSDEPNDVYVSSATFASPRRLSHMNPQLANVAIGATEVVTWKSSDGQEVEGVLIKPVGYVAGQRYPLLVEPHGGPTGAHNAAFKASAGQPGQMWAGRGWAVFYPNPRGSTGYGEKFMRGNLLDWGGGDYRDIMTGVDALVSRGIADPNKLGLEGWSYGGYMTAWMVTQTNRFKAARMGAGLSDLQSMYGTTDIPGYIGTFFNGNPTKATLDFYRERSPITYVNNVTTPLLIEQGASDERVPIGQSMEFYRAIKDQGKPVELVFYPREHHGFVEYYHLIDRMQRDYEWIAKYTLGPIG